MKLSRRDFIHSGCTAVAASLVPRKADARFPRGFISQTLNNNRVTINAASQFINIVKGFGFDKHITNCSADGYPVTSPPVALLNRGATNMPGGYYGTFTMSWSGSACMQINGPPLVVASGGTNIFAINSASGDQAAGSNIEFGTNVGSVLTVATNPTIVFAFGWNIQSIGNNGSGLIRITCKTGYVNSTFSYAQSGIDQNGNSGPLVNITGASANTGANGLWVMTNATATTFDLVGSTFTNAQASPAGQGIVACSGMSMQWNTTTGFSSLSNWLWYRTVDATDLLTNGYIYDDVYVSQLKTLFNNGTSPSAYGWLRFMDATAVQGSYESSFANRTPTTYLDYPANYFIAGFKTTSSGAAISSSGGGVSYTCSDASTVAWNGSTYNDGAVIQGIPDVTNTSAFPTLAVGAGPAKPIYNTLAEHQNYICAGSLPTAGQTMQFTFAATWLNGGSTLTLNYVTSAGVTATGNTTGSSTTVVLSAVTGTTFTGNVVSGSGIPAGTTITAGSGGAGTYTFSNAVNLTNVAITINNDTASFTTLNFSLRAFFGANSILSGATVQFANSTASGNGTSIFSRSRQVQGSGSTGTGPLTVTYVSGPACLTIGRIPVSTIQSAATPSGVGGTESTFIYNFLLDGWLYQHDGIVQGIPLEAMADLCNRVGAHCWYNFSIATSSAYITAVANFFATNLNPGLRFGFEVGNENWNPAHLLFIEFGLATCLNFSTGSANANAGWQGLKTRQYAPISKAAWTAAGRSASDHYVFQMWQVGNQIGQSFQTVSLNGSIFNTSTNPIYAAIGGLGGAAGTDYTTAPNRPVDFTNGIGQAPYWNSHWLGSGSFTFAGQVGGTVAQNAPWLQAALDFANGNTSTAFTSMANQFNGTTARSGGSNTGSNLADYAVWMGEYNTIAASYDGAGRVTAGLPNMALFDYEGGPSFGVGVSGNTGVNSVTFNTVVTGDITALAAQFTALSWDVSPYTVSTTNNPTEMATMALEMLQAWKFDVTNTGAAANTSSYSNLIQTYYYGALKSAASNGREVHPAQYGYYEQNWGFYPEDFHGGTPYTNFNACQTWNAGG